MTLDRYLPISAVIRLKFEVGGLRKEGERVCLGPVQPDDVDTIRSWSLDAGLADAICTGSDGSGPETGKDVWLSARARGSEQLLGVCEIRVADWDVRRAEVVAVSAGPAADSPMVEAVGLACAFASLELGLSTSAADQQRNGDARVDRSTDSSTAAQR